MSALPSVGVPGRLAYPREEAAELLGVSILTVDRLAREGRLKKIHLRGAARITRASIEHLLEGGEG